jgi:integrase
MPVVGRRLKSTERKDSYALRAFYRVAGVKTEYTEEDVRRAVEKLEAMYKPSYVNRIFKIARRRIASWPEDIKHKFSKASYSRIALRTPALKAMIGKLKASDDLPLHRGYFLLATLYGLRSVELRSVRQEDVDLDEGSIFVRTAKGGVERTHLIPESARHYLRGLTFEPVSEDRMRTMYRLIESISGIEHVLGAGWHSVRRAVVTALGELGFPEIKAYKFFRWSDETSKYKTYARFEWRKADAEVFEVHPFLKLWEASNA